MVSSRPKLASRANLRREFGRRNRYAPADQDAIASFFHQQAHPAPAEARVEPIKGNPTASEFIGRSKDRLSHGVCESEHGYLWSIADEASRAVMTCSAFRETIRTSPWAQPVRTVLAPSLTLKSLSGELAVIKDSSWQNWNGVDAHFTKGGLSFWARAEGAYGYAVKIDFATQGHATWGYLHYDDATGDISWRTEPATYSIAKPNGAKGKRTLEVVHGGKTETYTLGVESGWQYNDAPLFTLTPNAGSTQTKLYSLVSECDA